jgi:hypothetical protein
MTEDEISWADPLGPNEPEAAPAQPYFANVDEFVRLYLLPNWRRNTLHARWCATWWEHAEAITRLEAIWESWERHRLEPGTGMAVWWRAYADPHMAVLTDRDAGPLHKCDASKDRHEVPPVWPSNLPPAGLFHDANQEA